MKIYFAGSIRGAKVGTELYEGIVKHLKSHGEVLTEHVAHAFKNPDKYNIAFTKKDIFDADLHFLDAAEILVAEVTASSHGVGRELCYAEKIRNIPILCIHQEGVDISAMIEGNDYLNLQSYTELDDCLACIDSFFEKHAPKKEKKK